jgi:hypothetical protein
VDNTRDLRIKCAAANSGGLLRRNGGPSGLPEPIRHTPVHSAWAGRREPAGGTIMNGIIYLIGLIVVILAILSFFGLR